MGMSIDNLAYDYGDDTYYTSGFHDFFLSYYFYFKNPSNNLLTEVAINPGDAYRYQGDLTSLLLSLASLKIPPASFAPSVSRVGLISPSLATPKN